MRMVSFPSREEWLDARRNSIGASEAVIICGQGYGGSSPWTVWKSKREGIQEELDSDRIIWGSLLESGIAKGVERFTEYRLCEYLGIRVFSQENTPYLTATPDALLFDKQGRRGVLETKNVDRYQSKEWETQAPLRVQIQVQHQLYCTGLDWGVAACLSGGNRLFYHVLQRDQPFIDKLVVFLGTWWQKHVVEGTPPPIDESDATRRVLSQTNSNGQMVLLDADADDVVVRYQHAAKKLKAAQREYDLAANELRQIMGANEVGKTPRGKRVSFKAAKNGSRRLYVS